MYINNNKIRNKFNKERRLRDNKDWEDKNKNKLKDKLSWKD